MIIKVLTCLAMSSFLLSASQEKYPLINLENGEHLFQLKKGETLCLQLITNPSTGYDWEVSAQEEDICFEIISASEKEETPLLVGKPEKKFLKITALKEGLLEITLKYKRSWEKEVLLTQIIRLQVEKDAKRD